MVTRILIILLALAVSASAQRICPPNQVNRNGLVGRWLVPGKQTGTVATPTLCLDDSGNGNHGSTVSSPNYGVIFSRPAMTFNGSSQYVSLPTNTSVNNATQVTISYWAKKTASNKGTFIGFMPSKTDGIWLHWFTDGTVYFSPRNTANGVGTSYAISYDNNWHHFTGVFDGSQSNSLRGKIYIDGTLVGYTTNGTLPTSLGSTGGTSGYIGWDSVDAVYSSGSIDDVRIYNRTLSASEIRAIYQGEQ